MSSRKMGEDMTIVCREARKRFAALSEQTEGARIVPLREKLSVTERAATERHLQTCARCGHEYRLFTLSHAAMDAAASGEPIAPGEDFFKALRARIERGDDAASLARPDESWAGALLLTARQMIPAMAMLLLLIIGATLLWHNAPAKSNAAPATGGQADKTPRRERTMMPDLYEYAVPTADDVLETLVAIEEKKNGK